eukprot:5656998-Amphidinium_carterae.1
MLVLCNALEKRKQQPYCTEAQHALGTLLGSKEPHFASATKESPSRAVKHASITSICTSETAPFGLNIEIVKESNLGLGQHLKSSASS